MEHDRLTVWVDNDLCSGCGRCVDTAPEVFEHVDGLSHVRLPGEPAIVPFDQQDNVIRAAEECPGEIIYLDTIYRTIPK